MIIDIMLYIIAYFFGVLLFVLPKWIIWPQAVTDGFTYFAGVFARLNFILPVDTFFNCLSFLIGFEAAYLTAKIIVKTFNYVRGTGSGLDI